MNTIFEEKKETMHIGNNIKRIREIQGIKQEALGQLCKSKYSQQRISDFENMVAFDEPLLKELADALGVTPDFVKSFKDENVIYNIQNNNNSTFSDNSVGQNAQPIFNNDGSDKLLALLEKFIEEDRIKTQSIAALSKAVLDLASEVKKLKEDRNN
ncbi:MULTISPECIES: helix-turn-helix domain-containing protein [unclassified Sphingobacterium]|uniref:helix-turn-helix domain-containing protein n=1 Tax=unclassified Sphingobacterium TaxID=2609468 RepID=UPI0014390172|nr:helix-turn-helix transcriptional regulator [Sphingobacterium sp. B16(2022)]NJI76420.1 helix-turn-helix transcriptional regulator [Sphingobacterium sp. B16(2022)]